MQDLVNQNRAAKKALKYAVRARVEKERAQLQREMQERKKQRQQERKRKIPDTIVRYGVRYIRDDLARANGREA